MTCHDAREVFSALIDERLSREERADVYGHLATCADCRRELAAVERTVTLVRGSTPPRVPAGFVDRVVAAARPTPWYVRTARAMLLPWPVKVPLGAAALLLVGGLAVLMFRGTEKPPRAARYEAPPTAPAPPVARSAPSESREKSAVAKLESLRSAAPSVTPPDVVARLATPDPGTAERALAALAARLAGAETGRRVDGDALVVELAIPRERYADFKREVARLGDYRPESEAARLPETVRIAVRLGS